MAISSDKFRDTSLIIIIESAYSPGSERITTYRSRVLPMKTT
jgi:hypothetical protein